MNRVSTENTLTYTAAEGTISVDYEKVKILVVEDDPSFSEVVTTELEKKSCKVFNTAKVADAILKMKNQKFDLIILDMKLEGGSGEQVISFARNNKGFNSETPILVISGFLDPSLVKRVGAQVSGILVKPFDARVFMERFEAILASPKRRMACN